MMKLLLMRHGEASWDAAADRMRPLTPRGALVVRQQAELLHHKRLLPDVILHSDFLRAQQTAAIVAQVLQCDRLEESESWQPDVDPQAAVATLERYADESLVLVVTHMPLVGRVSGLLCEGRAGGGPAFSTAALQLLELEWPAAGVGISSGFVTA